MRNLQPRDCLLGQSPDENPWHNRAAQCAAPTGETVPSRRAAKGRPYSRKQTGSVGSVKPGAEDEPQRRKFLQTQGPVARRGFRHPLKFCAPKIFCLTQGIPPVTGVQGVGEYGHEVPILSLPLGASLASFWASRKKLAARRRRNSLRQTKTLDDRPLIRLAYARHPSLSPLSRFARHLPLTRGVGPRGEGL